METAFDFEHGIEEAMAQEARGRGSANPLKIRSAASIRNCFVSISCYTRQIAIFMTKTRLVRLAP